MTNSGLDRFIAEPELRKGCNRCALVVNHSAVDSKLRHILKLCSQLSDIQLIRLFGPEHGLWGIAQDMIAVSHTTEPSTGLPLHSLYGSHEASLTPPAQLLADIDTVLFDIQDIGSRYYTYAATLAMTMEMCSQTNTRCVVFDRPNPINANILTGNRIEPNLHSFVGYMQIPNRHGMTMGELALYHKSTNKLDLDLQVIKCSAYKRSMWFDETGLPWVMPSPNMPTLETATVYPGACLIEGTNLSEGRGTTRPFELIGAPFLDGFSMAQYLNERGIPGVYFRPHLFQPSFQKHVGATCQGIQLHLLDRDKFEPLSCFIEILHYVKNAHPEQFVWREEAYEFRSDVPAIDLLFGSAAVRQAFDSGETVDTIKQLACTTDNEFLDQRDKFLLYN